jgi:SAM-dependent methyltransferase
MKRTAPAALRNREPIAEVLKAWLPEQGLVLEIASGTGEHAVHFAQHFPKLDWQPTDPDPEALTSIAAWRESADLPNLLEPVALDASEPWPDVNPDAILCINMAHISPWQATLGVLDGAADRLAPEGPLIFYGPWFEQGTPTVPSNLDFDAQLRSRNSSWGLRKVEELNAAAAERGLTCVDRRRMPANNIMLLFRQIHNRR